MNLGARDGVSRFHSSLYFPQGPREYAKFGPDWAKALGVNRKRTKRHSILYVYSRSQKSTSTLQIVIVKKIYNFR